MRSDLIGRRSLVAELTNALRTDSAGVLLSGDFGVGKSVLWRTLLAEAAEDGVVATVFGARGLQSIPLGAIAPLLGDLPTTPMNRTQFVSIAAESIRRLSDHGELVLGVDDAHLLDEASGAIVEHAVRSGTARLVATRAAAHPLPEWLRSLTQLGFLVERSIEPLGQSDSRALIAQLLPGAGVDPSLAAELWRLSQGNPFALIQIVASSVQSDAIVMAEDVWTAPHDLRVGGHLSDLLDAQLAQRTADERGALEFASVPGTVELALLESVATAASIEALEADGLLEVDRSDKRASVRLSSALLASRVDARLPTTRRLRIHAQMSQWLTRAGADRSGDALRVAQWGLDAGTDLDVDIAVTAARHALAVSSPQLAERLCLSVLAREPHFEAQLMLGQALHAQGATERALVALGRASELATTDREAVRAAIARSEVLAIGNFDLDAAIELAGAVEASLTDPECRQELSIESARLALQIGDPEQAIELAEEIAHAGATSPQNRLAILTVSSVANLLVARFDRALDDVTAVKRLMDDGTTGTRRALERVLSTKVRALQLVGRLDEAIEVATLRQAQAREDRDPHLQAMWGSSIARLLMWHGNIDAARDGYDESLRELSRFDPFGIEPRVSALACLADAQGGDAAAARKRLESLPGALSTLPIQEQLLAARAHAWLTALDGDLQGAALQAGEVAARARTYGLRTTEAVVRHDAVRFGHRLADADRPTVEADGRLLPTLLAHEEALRAGDGPALDAVSGALAAMGVNLLAAEAANHAVAAYSGVRDHASARRARARVDALLSLCTGAATSAIATVEPLLTARQNEIARLASEKSNAEIADELHLSVRTVESHLQAVYGSLGIHGRAELADIYAPGTTPGAADTGAATTAIEDDDVDRHQ